MKKNGNNQPPLFLANIFIKSIIKNNNGVVKIKKYKKPDEKADNKDDETDIWVWCSQLKNYLYYVLLTFIHKNFG
jgi:hypothetical protein